jgi:hypothetical protein
MRASVVLLFGLAGCVTDAAPPPLPPLPSPDTLRELNHAEKIALAKSLSAGLKDPSATQFRWAKVNKTHSDGRYDYCGQLNAKNSYGGYVGYRPFLATIYFNSGKVVRGELIEMLRGEVINPPDIQTLLETAVERECRKRGLDSNNVSDS